MGLFSFLKNAGAKILSSKAEEKQAELNAEKETSMKAIIHDLGLHVKDFSVNVDGDSVVVYGETDNQEVKEKVILALGNVAGIAIVDDKLSVVNASTESTFYVVQPGDSLSKIAKEVYGDAMKYNAIFEANKPMLKSVDLIYPGQVLRVPAQGFKVD